jgi:hypothetical protein
LPLRKQGRLHAPRSQIAFMTLLDSFIQSALENINSPHIIGVGMIGSYARGQEARYSDVVNKTLSLIEEAGL